MKKIKLHLTLVGKTDEWKKYIRSGEEFSNANNLEYVRDIVKEQFGERPMFITNENTLRDDVVVYPKYFSAGWFISEEQPLAELVVIAHGESMEVANKAMLESVKKIDWTTLARKI
jgi:hypothetical protein